MKNNSNENLMLDLSIDSDILTIVKEDILRTLGEKKEVSLEIIKDEIARALKFERPIYQISKKKKALLSLKIALALLCE